MSKFSVLDQCLKAFSDVAHDHDCAAAMIRGDFPCACTRRTRLAVGLDAAIKRACSLAFKRLSNEERAHTMLAWFVRSANKPVEIRGTSDA